MGYIEEKDIIDVKDYNKVNTQVNQLPIKEQWKEQLRQSLLGVTKGLDVLSSYRRPLLEYGGATAGGIVGGAGGTVLGAGPWGTAGGAIAGSGGGFAAGSKIADILDIIEGKQQPQPLLQQLSESAKDVRTGAEAEFYGQGIGPLFSTIISKARLVKPLTEQMLGRVQLAERTGVDLTRAQVRGTKPIGLLEQAFSQALPTAGQAQKQAVKEMQQIQEFADNILRSKGGELETLPAGIMAQQTFAKREVVWRKLVDRAYNQAKNVIGIGTPIPAKNASETANDLALSIAQARTKDKGLLETINRFTQDTTPTFEGIIQEQKYLNDEIGKAIKSGERYKASIYTQLKQSLEKDLDDYALQVGGTFKGLYDKAKLLHQFGKGNVPGADVFRAKEIKNIIESNPEGIMKQVFRVNNATEAGMIKRGIGKEGWNKLQQSWLTDMFTKGQQKTFNPTVFSTNFYKYDKATLDILADKELQFAMKDLADVGIVAKSAENLAGKPSGTGQALITWGLISGSAGLILKNPITGVSIFITPPIMAKWYYSKTGRDYLKAGLRTKLTSSNAKKVYSQLIKLGTLEISKSTKETE